jgi:hypothetical protein
MRLAPEWFSRQLKQEHDGRLRIRWSPARLRWQIEQKVDTAKLAPFHVDSMDDDAIRAIDGYSRICEICPGSLTPCSNTGLDGKTPCGYDLKVPYAQFVQVKCPQCKLNGFNGGQIVAHFELNEALLNHLRSIDPNRGVYERQRAKLRTANKDLVARRHNELKKDVIYAAKDDMRVCIPKVGYTGKEFLGAA